MQKPKEFSRKAGQLYMLKAFCPKAQCIKLNTIYHRKHNSFTTGRKHQLGIKGSHTPNKKKNHQKKKKVTQINSSHIREGQMKMQTKRS